jgi:hypothetical protein
MDWSSSDRDCDECLSNRMDINDNVRIREDFGGVRKESPSYSNELWSHLEIQDALRREKGRKPTENCRECAPHLCGG